MGPRRGGFPEAAQTPRPPLPHWESSAPKRTLPRKLGIRPIFKICGTSSHFFKHRQYFVQAKGTFTP